MSRSFLRALGRHLLTCELSRLLGGVLERTLHAFPRVDRGHRLRGSAALLTEPSLTPCADGGMFCPVVGFVLAASNSSHEPTLEVFIQPAFGVNITVDSKSAHASPSKMARQATSKLFWTMLAAG